MRDIENYLAYITENNLTLNYIFETHFHADFVSGHFDLRSKLNSKIVFGNIEEPQNNFI
jgi:glyoxylase-like metal-dependent hydrolase (beta-lactamase superfamily II)